MSATAAVVTRQVNPFEMSGTRSGDQANIHSERLANFTGHAAFAANAGQQLLPSALRVVEPGIPDTATPRTGTTGGLAPWQVKKIKQHIETRIAHGIPLDELAQQVRLSTSYFSAAFKSTFGVSPHSYIVSCRVDHAKYLMLTGNAPLCEIALDCGLADQSHLSRVFRRVAGTTPSAWRRYSSRPQAAVALQ